MSDHECQFDWCANEATQLDHFSTTHYAAATGNSRCGIPDKLRTADMPTIGVGLRFDEELDPSPLVYVHIHGGWQGDDVDSELRIDEAVIFHKYLGRVIQTALAGTNLNPHRIVGLYIAEADRE